MNKTRRDFFADVGRGMLIASVGPALAADLGFGTALAEEAPNALTFGKLEPLVCLMQETGPDKLLPILVEKLKTGTTLNQLVSAAALANVRTFGGEDYVGFHTMMALSPCYHMAQELPTDKQALPVLKVLYRNSNRIQEKGGRKDEVLQSVSAQASPGAKPNAEDLRKLVLNKDLAGAEKTFAALSAGSPEDALNGILCAVEDATEVHRVVMVSRAWDLLDIVGKERAHTLLRQSVHYCIKNENESYIKNCGLVRDVLPKVLDRYSLQSKKPGDKTADDSWIDELSSTIFKATPEEAADAAAQALSKGYSRQSIGEAISLAANQLILRDPGRPKEYAQPNKPVGSVHGDSTGVHGCDSANAWRNLANASNPRNSIACLILGAYQVAFDRGMRSKDFLKWEPNPRPEALEKVKGKDQAALIKELDGAVREKDQARACAIVQRYGELNLAPRSIFDVLLRYAVSEDGALHAEKYYRTVSEEFQRSRPAYRWRQLVALARVTASEYGTSAPGYKEACELLKV